MKHLQAMLALAVLIAGAADAALGQTKIALQHSATTDYLPVDVAKEKGFFAKRGLDVEPTVSPQPGAIPAAVAGGSLQIGTATATQIASADAAGLDFVVLAGASIQTKANPTISVVASPSANIKSPADFKGRKVATPGLNGALHVMFQKWLLDNKVDPKSVTFIDTGFAQMGDLLKSGQVDAALPVEPFRSRMIQNGVAVSAGNYFAEVQDNTLISLYFSTRSWAQANAKAVADFRAGVQEGIDYIHAHPAEAKAVAASYLKLPPQIIESLPQPDLRVDVPAATLQFWLDLSKDLGLIDKKLDAASILFR